MFEFTVKRRAPDFQPARDLRHLPAVMRYGEADDLEFDVLERPDIAVRTTSSGSLLKVPPSTLANSEISELASLRGKAFVLEIPVDFFLRDEAR